MNRAISSEYSYEYTSFPHIYSILCLQRDYRCEHASCSFLNPSIPLCPWLSTVFSSRLSRLALKTSRLQTPLYPIRFNVFVKSRTGRYPSSSIGKRRILRDQAIRLGKVGKDWMGESGLAASATW